MNPTLVYQHGSFTTIIISDSVPTDFSVNDLFSIETMSGKFLLSLYVGNITLYFIFDAVKGNQI